MPRLLATRKLRLRDFTVEAGQEFDLPGRQAEALVSVRFAKRVDEDAKAPVDDAPEVCATEVDPTVIGHPYEPPYVQDCRATKKLRGPDKKPRKQRTYKRRDMVSEG